ncbi:MAG TPA: methionine--tRNA ligase [Nanoarchaeota archaeon]|nr:methionine--tRNA ligase [Nanoarchaeota archaeon]
MIQKLPEKKFYITTAIDYVNARPHIGHAFEKVLADAIARWHKFQGEKVFFLTGTDENAQKNAQVAKQENMDVQKFVDRNSQYFVELCKVLEVEYSRFIRTTEEEHKRLSQEIFKKVYDKGDIYNGKYEGWYCIGCEGFKTEKDLVDGKCPEHDKKPEWVSEEAYFFRLSKYRDKLIKFVEGYIVPESRRNEILARLENEELKDLCVSRKNLDWGIDSPIDKKHKIYVWFDALINYISGAEGNWPAEVHVIGKGINWFHSVIWPAMLMSAGYKLPETLLVHGYVNLKGQKISKSLGNTIDPVELAKKYGADVIRYSLLRGSVFEDFDFSEDTLKERNNELADKLGNLVSRLEGLGERAEEIKKISPDAALGKKLKLKEIQSRMKNYELDKALALIIEFVDECNKYVQEKKVWELQDAEKNKALYTIADSLRVSALLLHAFIPATSEEILSRLGEDKITLERVKFGLLGSVKLKKKEHLFAKVG